MGNFKDMLASRSPESQARIKEMGEEMLLISKLHMIRDELKFSQTDLAEGMGISQPSVAAIEARGNEMKISTLKRYVESMGGELRIDIKLPTGKHVIFGV
ncbi:XRE family transcriptional regulator [Budviciaceae bacterium BWR-B9]|uniref:XRE family transcriptional regulator n=1 Tax=Limnobaculum allomyrinae TaxID=2791986 RepID=A0ABS1INE2_9GAMM|nr:MULTISPECIES: helix-turn-helix domain-containing protein [Limnobaculum]MBK5143270.1 XRE family transcriptional regulator [Limnobaculum allomyrinae]MBV7691158.1 helix-turn-helix domain-containing protein [Limnobaculum sp. M2-1]